MSVALHFRLRPELQETVTREVSRVREGPGQRLGDPARRAGVRDPAGGPRQGRGHRRVPGRAALRGPCRCLHRRRPHRRGRLPGGESPRRRVGRRSGSARPRLAGGWATRRRSAGGLAPALSAWIGTLSGDDRDQPRPGADRQLRRGRPPNGTGGIVWACLPRFDGDAVRRSLLRTPPAMAAPRCRDRRLCAVLGSPSPGRTADLGQESAPAAPISPVPLVVVEEGKLTVDVHHAELESVLREIATRAAFDLRTSGKLGRVTATFAGVSLEEGLRQLVRDAN